MRANRLVAIIDVATRDVKRASSGVMDPHRPAEAKTTTATSSSTVSRALFSPLGEGGEAATAAVASRKRKSGGERGVG